MFSSNQKLHISCPLQDLEQTLDFLLTMANLKEMFTRKECTVHPAYQITSNGFMLIGTGSMEPGENHLLGIKAPDGWTDFNPKIEQESIISALSDFIKKWVETEAANKLTNPEWFNGTAKTGVEIFGIQEMRFISRIFGINGYRMDLAIRPYNILYSK